jgi:hypothetical protein
MWHAGSWNIVEHNNKVIVPQFVAALGHLSVTTKGWTCGDGFQSLVAHCAGLPGRTMRS